MRWNAAAHYYHDTRYGNRHWRWRIYALLYELGMVVYWSKHLFSKKDMAGHTTFKAKLRWMEQTRRNIYPKWNRS